MRVSRVNSSCSYDKDSGLTLEDDTSVQSKPFDCERGAQSEEKYKC